MSTIIPASRRVTSARLPALDGVRGLLAFFVAFAHYEHSCGNNAFIPAARIAVIGFFLLSSYVLTVAWDGNFVTFLGKQFLRLWPTYAVAIAWATYLSGGSTWWCDFFWFPYGHFASTVVWSLYIEVYANLAMPLILVCAQTPVTALLSCLFLIVAGKNIGIASFGVYFIIGSFAARYPVDIAILRSALCRWLGKISYSLYLTHPLVILLCKYRLGGLYWPWIALPACLAVAVLFWNTIERPSLWASRVFAKKFSSQEVKVSSLCARKFVDFLQIVR